MTALVVLTLAALILIDLGLRMAVRHQRRRARERWPQWPMTISEPPVHVTRQPRDGGR